MSKRLQTVLAHAGVASRRRAAELIESGSVKVNGKTITERGYRVDPDVHEILVDGRPIRKEEKKVYFLFHKPRNVISTVSDTHGRKKVTDYFKHVKARLYPVGRLDKDTTGLLLITNDGQITHRLAHPSFEIDKEYMVTLDGYVTKKDIKKLERGIEMDGKKTSPCVIKIVRSNVVRLKLHEGRKRQIKHMFKELGQKVTDLKRVKYAGLTLGRLEEGEYRELSEKEVERLKAIGKRQEAVG